jgi:hypothetical protein
MTMGIVSGRNEHCSRHGEDERCCRLEVDLRLVLGSRSAGFRTSGRA